MILATTALEETWGADESLLFLGEWCQLYDRKDTWSNRDFEIVPYHWDDREKLKRDYHYLHNLHGSLLEDLSLALNNYHNLDRPVRYWQIIIDPWLLTYIAVIFDRWECLRVAFEEYGSFQTVELDISSLNDCHPSFAYNEYMNEFKDDFWNYCLFIDIINTSYHDKCEFTKVDRLNLLKNAGSLACPKKGGQEIRKKIIGFIISKLDCILNHLSKQNPAFFYTSYFPITSLIHLHFSLRQLPCLLLNEFSLPKASAVSPDFNSRKKITLNRTAENSFEEYLLNRIYKDIPLIFLEAFQSNRNKANKMIYRPKAIFTANGHWGNELFKIFAAEQVHNWGVKVITMEHGGAIPPLFNTMEFEEDIGDIRTTWSTPYHHKHVQIPPNKIVDIKIKSKRKYCGVVGVELSRYPCRREATPIAGQILVHYNMVCELHHFLNNQVQKMFRIRPYPDQGWNTKQRFIDNLGFDKVNSDGTLYEFYSSAKVIVCTYPQTTFSEAMSSGLPTILMYPEHLWETRPEFDCLLGILKKAKIVFTDPKSAAYHVNAIWDNPDQWWNNSEVLAARESFHQMACRNDSNWLEQWTAFVKGVIDK
ncbi:hypothetical protein FTO68_05640 [Methanocalculus taiwanensis]|uniref:Transferase n=1 Tax=Methanocalculus taiwanensis TaxID=106207 RepID=A0ABD4TL46_9EURY|nr:LIC12162 family protein [Methanocalculus taiwanensis]MCQ1538469.1 hypothetical protein [Methanocalculus taiwanensis]